VGGRGGADREIGLVALLDGLERGPRCSRLPGTRGEVGLGLDQADQPATQHGVIVDDRPPQAPPRCRSGGAPGPDRLARWDKGSRIVLDAHPHYWAGPPALPRIELVVVPDNTARAQAFEAGDLDLIQSPLVPRFSIAREKSSPSRLELTRKT